MSLSDRLAASFPGCAFDPAAVQERVDIAIAAARTRWPKIRIDEDALTTWLVARLDVATTPLEVGIDKLRLVDLILASACASGDAHALAAFDAEHLSRDGRLSEDIKQQLRVRLFVGPTARIASYGGRGELGSWVKTVATRLEIDASRVAHDVPVEASLLEAIEVDPTRGPVHTVLKAEAREVMQGALRSALAGLGELERTLLLQYYIDGVGVVPLGKLHNLAPSNVSRRLAKARLALLARVKRVLGQRHQLSATDLASIIDLVQSQLTVTGGLRG